jgi:hypothetical protein
VHMSKMLCVRVFYCVGTCVFVCVCVGAKCKCVFCVVCRICIVHMSM